MSKKKEMISMPEFKLVFYMLIHSKLEEMSKVNSELNISKIESYLNQNHRIPKKLTPLIIKELENMELVTKVNRYSIKVVTGKSKILQNMSKLYHQTGLW